jgi:hypothetical protein
VQVLNRVENRETRPDPEEEGDLTETRFQVGNDCRTFREPGQFHGAVHGHGRRTRSAFRAKEDERDRWRSRRGIGRFAA